MGFTKCLLQPGSSGDGGASERAATRGNRCLFRRQLHRSFQKLEAGNRHNNFRTMRRSWGLNSSVARRLSPMDKPAVLALPGAVSRADGDQDLFLALTGMFLQESPKEAAAARAALERQDRAGLAGAAHKFQGSVAGTCAPRLFGSTKRMGEF